MAKCSERAGEIMISATKYKLEKILDEIQSSNVNCTSVENESKSMEEVLNILLLDNISVPTTDSVQIQKSNVSKNGLFDIDEMMRWRNNNNNIYQLRTHWPVTSHRKWIGNLIVFGKKTVRKLLRWYIDPIAEQQNAINGSFTASINALCNNELVTAEQLKNINAKLVEIDQQYQNKFTELQAIYEERQRQLEHKYEETIETIKRENIAQPYSNIDYAKFEDYFRGNQQEIKMAQTMYLPFFNEKENVLDLGCGRGEFLELLKENNISAVGVDVYTAFVKQCQEKGLNVVHADAITYLAQQQDDSLGGIFAAQLVEHLSVDDIVSLCDLAYKKLEKGSCVVIETPNPSCMSTYFNSFYLDPTHEKPIHPKALEYFLREAGFADCEIVYTEQSKVPYRLPLLSGNEIENLADFNNGINFLSDIIFGSQDYAIIARK